MSRISRSVWQCALAVALLADRSAAAQVPYGNVAYIDTANTLPGPLRLFVTARFLAWNGSEYVEATAGAVELKCPQGHDDECREQWAIVTSAREQDNCVQFGWDVAPVRASTSPTAPAKMTWALARGVTVLAAGDPLCARTRALPPPPNGLRPSANAAPPGPQEMPYDETQPIQPGYHLEDRHRRGLLIAGGTVFTSGTLILLIGATSKASGWANGPEVVMALGGIVMLVGGGLFIGGLPTHRVLVRNETALIEPPTFGGSLGVSF